MINTYGKQVIDTWAFNPLDHTEHLSMSHTRSSILRLIPSVGDTLVSNNRRAMLTLVADSTPGAHSTLIPACDVYRYQMLGAADHDNCVDNLQTCLKELNIIVKCNPDPLNLFMDVLWNQDGDRKGNLAFGTPMEMKGGYVEFRAEMDLWVVLSACPQDMVKGYDMGSMDAHYEIV